MNFVPYERSKLGNVYKLGKNQAMLREFAESGQDCVKVENYPHRDAKSCQTTLMGSLATIGLNNTIRVVVRGGEVFLLRKDCEG